MDRKAPHNKELIWPQMSFVLWLRNPNWDIGPPRGFPDGASGEEFACQCRRVQEMWVGRSRGALKWLLTPVFKPDMWWSLGTELWAGLWEFKDNDRELPTDEASEQTWAQHQCRVMEVYFWTQVHVHDAQWGQTNRNVGVWSRVNLLQGQAKGTGSSSQWFEGRRF